MKGTVKFYKEDKGFGFINGEDGNEYFFHITNVKNNDTITLESEDNVTFDVAQGEKGDKAVDIDLVS